MMSFYNQVILDVFISIETPTKVQQIVNIYKKSQRKEKIFLCIILQNVVLIVVLGL